MGVGLARGVGALDMRVIGNIVVSWVVTLPAGGILAALFSSFSKGYLDNCIAVTTIGPLVQGGFLFSGW